MPKRLPKNVDPTTSVSIRANDTYKDALAVVAKRHGKLLADFVRDALDQLYGDEIKRAIHFLAANGGQTDVPMDTDETSDDDDDDESERLAS